MSIIADSTANDHTWQNQSLPENWLEDLQKQVFTDAHATGEGEHISCNGNHALQKYDDRQRMAGQVKSPVCKPGDQKQQTTLQESDQENMKDHMLIRSIELSCSLILRNNACKMF